MAKYAFVENDEVVEVKNRLPVSFRNVSNFYLLPEAERNSRGWYDVVEDTTVSTQDYSRSGAEYTFSGGVVTEEITFTRRTIPEYKAYLIELLKPIFANKMLGDYPDYEQRLAALGLLPVAYVNTMKSVFSDYLSTFSNYKDAINAASDYATLNNYYDLIIAWGNN